VPLLEIHFPVGLPKGVRSEESKLKRASIDAVFGLMGWLPGVRTLHEDLSYPDRLARNEQLGCNKKRM
jgi:hypothetical protein